MLLSQKYYCRVLVTHWCIQTTTTTKGKSKYRSATLPSKRKTAVQQMDFADDNFAKMTPDYGEANGSQEQVRMIWLLLAVVM